MCYGNLLMPKKGYKQTEEHKAKALAARLQGVRASWTPERRARLGASRSMENHPLWKGDDVGYRAAHKRVAMTFGHASLYTCSYVSCDADANEWANITGRHHDVEDYAPMCYSCHRRMDFKRRNTP